MFRGVSNTGTSRRRSGDCSARRLGLDDAGDFGVADAVDFLHLAGDFAGDALRLFVVFFEIDHDFEIDLDPRHDSMVAVRFAMVR